MSVAFVHRHAAHCESGVTAGLLSHYGLPLSEAMAFGIGSGLFFGYLPFIRVNRLPLITYRSTPGSIFRTATRRLGVQVKSRTFRDPGEAERALDRTLEEGVPVGLQTSVYWLPYLPHALRFHFNAHNLVVYGKEDDGYRISDPVVDTPVICSAEDLRRARFAKGALAPRGRLYYVDRVPAEVDILGAARVALRQVCRRMTLAPVPIIGTRGIRFLASRLAKWPERLGTERAALHLGHLIRMQEEIGTGGGGFRFVFAAFLQEVGVLAGDPHYGQIAEEVAAAGDRWREFAALAARNCRRRVAASVPYPELAALLVDCAAREESFCRALLALRP